MPLIKIPDDMIESGVGTSANNLLKLDSSGNLGITGTVTADGLTVDLTNASGITLRDSSTSSASPWISVIGKRSDGNSSQAFSGKLILAGHQTNSAVSSNKSLGTISFGGNHTDGSEANILYPASISGVAEGTFSNSTAMPTGIAFYTGSIGRAQNQANLSFGTERMRIDSSGNVGIGTANPTSNGATATTLDIKGSAYSFLSFGNDTNSVQAEIQADTNGVTIAEKIGGFLRFSTSNTERMRITNTGNVGIGVTTKSWTSTYKALQIGDSASLSARTTEDTVMLSNNAYNDSVNSRWEYIGANGTQKASQYNMNNDGAHEFKVAPSGAADSAISWTTAMTIDNSGYSTSFGAFSTTGASRGVELSKGVKTSDTGTGFDYHHRFYNANGQVGYISTQNSSTQYNTSSDYRLKENVVPMSGSIDRLKELKPSRFNFITDPNLTVDGFLAHEAQAIVPECVSGEKDGMKMEEYEVTEAVMDGETLVTEAIMGEREVPDMQGIDQSKLVPLLVGAIQELTARLEVLENK